MIFLSLKNAVLVSSWGPSVAFNVAFPLVDGKKIEVVIWLSGCYEFRDDRIYGKVHRKSLIIACHYPCARIKSFVCRLPPTRIECVHCDCMLCPIVFEICTYLWNLFSFLAGGFRDIETKTSIWRSCIYFWWLASALVSRNRHNDGGTTARKKVLFESFINPKVVSTFFCCLKVCHLWQKFAMVFTSFFANQMVKNRWDVKIQTLCNQMVIFSVQMVVRVIYL